MLAPSNQANQTCLAPRPTSKTTGPFLRRALYLLPPPVLLRPLPNPVPNPVVVVPPIINENIVIINRNEGINEAAGARGGRKLRSPFLLKIFLLSLSFVSRLLGGL